MKTTSKIAAILLLTILTFGCARNTVIKVDGLPISNHEYNLTNDETGIRAVFVLARYHREYEGKEYLVVPEYLNALQVNRIPADSTERLTLHIKVINLTKKHYSFSWEIEGPSGKQQGLWYTGKLSRKDFFMDLPLDQPGDIDYLFALRDKNGDDLFSLPLMGYRVEGGATKSDHK